MFWILGVVQLSSVDCHALGGSCSTEDQNALLWECDVLAESLGFISVYYALPCPAGQIHPI